MLGRSVDQKSFRLTSNSQMSVSQSLPCSLKVLPKLEMYHPGAGKKLPLHWTNMLYRSGTLSGVSGMLPRENIACFLVIKAIGWNQEASLSCVNLSIGAGCSLLFA